MSLTVDVLPVDPLPVVRLIVDLPQGRSWKVTGRTDDGTEWLAGEGRSSGAEQAFADPWAPLGVPATYELSSEGGSWVAGPVVRTHRGGHVLTDLSGRQVVSFLWEKGSGDPWAPDLRASYLDPWGSALPVVSSAPVAGAGGGSITIRTEGESTRTMRRLVASNRRMVLLHNEGRCHLPDCDVPLVRTIRLTGAPANLTARATRAERAWSIEYRLVPRPYAFLAPVATWADVAERWDEVGDLATSGLENKDVARGDWLVGW